MNDIPRGSAEIQSARVSKGARVYFCTTPLLFGLMRPPGGSDFSQYIYICICKSLNYVDIILNLIYKPSQPRPGLIKTIDIY